MKKCERQLRIYVTHHPTHLDAAWVDEVMSDRRERIDHKIDELIGSSLQERYASARATSVRPAAPPARRRDASHHRGDRGSGG